MRDLGFYGSEDNHLKVEDIQSMIDQNPILEDLF